MKTFTQCMTEIASAIANRQFGLSKNSLLVYQNTLFQVWNGLNHPETEIVIAKLTEKQCIEGLNTPEWYHIETRVRKLLLQGVIK